MTVQIDWGESRLNLHIEGDIYEEQAECLRDMVCSHAQHGMQELQMQFCSTYYISQKGRQCLQGLQDSMENRGVQVSVRSKESCLHMDKSFF